MNIRFKLTGALALLSALLIGCSGSTPGGSSSDITLSGVISNGSGALSVAGGVKKQAGGVTAAVVDYSTYSLYCVTFTVPPQSGSGNFVGPDANGQFSYSVTLTDAANLPIGCFIVDGSDAVKSTVTFNTGSGVSGSSGGAALTGGEHTVDIDFDPVSGSATATVTAGDVSSSVSGTYSAAELMSLASGDWTMSCPDIDPNTAGTQVDPLCDSFINGPYGANSVYINMAQGTMGTETVYAMGAWPNSTAFTTCGGHEGMNLTALGYHGVTTAPTQASSSNGGSAVGNFNGGTINHQTLVTAGAYTITQDAITGEGKASTDLATLITAISPTGTPAYDPTWNNAYLGGGTDWCPDTDTPSSIAAALTDTTSVGAQARSCYVGWVESMAEQGSSNLQACLPRIDGGKVQNQIWAWDNLSGQLLNTDNSLITVPFRTQLGGVSPEIGGRYSLMGAEVLGDAIIAHDFHEDQWTQWDDTTHTEYQCQNSEEMTIQLTPTGTSTATGRFTNKRWEYCNDGVSTPSDPAPTTFEVSFTKTAAAL